MDTKHNRLSSAWIKSLIFIYVYLVVIPKCIVAQNERQQSFRVTPHDMQILEGTEALLHCEVADLAGKVQWTKDGFALGFSAVIPGFPRYSVIVDVAAGIYNLRISNTTLEDDAEYQCQVGPAKGNQAIRANAKLNVIAPPTSIKIDGRSNNAKIEVRENQNLTLTCTIENAKPAAEIIWLRGNIEFKDEDHRQDNISETQMKRFTTTSKIHLIPTANDDYKDYACQAKHIALPPDVPMLTTVQLSVLYPPGVPFIEGYTPDETLRRGQSVELICRSRGGNPPAELTWYKNGEKISTLQRTLGRLSENTYTFIAESNDNEAKIKCEAKNLLSGDTPLSSEMKLTVLFSPSQVNIAGSSESKVGDIVPLTCTTAPSNPPAEIHWTVNGRQVESKSKTKISQDGGWVTSSNITVTVEPNKRSVVVVCHGLNMQLTENVVSTHTVNVLYPPSPPIISGYSTGQVISAGSVQKLLCVSSGGNPPPTLAWYKNDKKINSITKMVTNSVSAEISILANATDNQARYKCEVQNSAIEIPFFETRTLDVHFPPETVKIRVQPKELRPGTQATLICDSSSSNPPATVSWWKDGIPVEGVNPSNKAGLWSGTVSTLELKVNVSQDMDGIIYTCQSANEVLQRSVHETVSLDVYYAPRFDQPQQTVFTGVEGEPMRITLKATANPMTMTYTWTKDGFPISKSLTNRQRIVSDGGTLILSNIHRNDAGTYICEVMNSQGTATISITIIVEYGPTIETVSEEMVWTPGDDAILECTVSGKPITAEHIHWERPGYDMIGRTTVSFANGTSYLRVRNVQRDDVGNFTCHADNERSNAAKRDVLLAVKFGPEMDKTPMLYKYAAKLNDRGILRCRLQSAPEPRFTWHRDGKNIKMYNRRNKYKVVEHKIDALTFESVLTIEKVNNDDYGEYECVAKNELGQDTGVVKFVKPSRPDTPISLWVGNITENKVNLLWAPGFDGGLPVYYRIRYRELKDEKYKFIDVRPTATNVTIDGLKPNVAYLFSVMAANEEGGSKYLPDIKKTLSKDSSPTSAELMEKSEMPNLVIIGITSAAMVLLVLNAALVAWFVIRRQNKDSTDDENQNDDAYSKDDSQSDYKDGQHKKAASTYLVENVDIIQSASYPPKYQENPINSSPYGNNTDYTRTLPNPKRFNNKIIQDNRAKDDHMLVSNGLYIPSPSPASSLVIKGSYISSPSPAPPQDGSYYNMSDKYLSYPPIVY